MKKTKTVYYVDIVDVKATQSIVSVYHSENSDEAYEVAARWNEGLHNPQCMYYTETDLKAEVYEIEEEVEEEKEMNYQEKIKDLLQWMYGMACDFAGSSTYDIPYEWVKDGYQIDLTNEEIQDSIREIWGIEYLDFFQAIDFDDLHQKVYVMTWKSNSKKKYTINNYEEFCKNALQCPPLEEFEDGSIDEDKWYKEHNIHIITGNHDIELEYHADNVNEIEYALREMYEVEKDIRYATTGNTIGSEYRDATWKDILRFYVLDHCYNTSNPLSYWVHECIYHFSKEDFNQTMKAIDGQTSINDELEVNFFRLDTKDLWKICDRDERKQAFKEILCSNIDIEELIDEDGKHGDKVVIWDYSIKPGGDMVGWHYGVDFDKNSEDNQYYIEKYIEEMIG